MDAGRSLLADVRDRTGVDPILEFRRLVVFPSCALRWASVRVLTSSTSRSKSIEPSGSISPGHNGSRSYSVFVGRGVGLPAGFDLSKSNTITTPFDPAGAPVTSSAGTVLELPTAIKRCTLGLMVTHRRAHIS